MVRLIAAVLVVVVQQPIGVSLLMGDEAASDRPNVLFIAVDDLRPQLESYGADFMVTPHLDRLASEGRLFSRHYVQVPTCGASRCALLTGRYPRIDTDLSNDAVRQRMAGRVETKRPESFAHLFRRNGYHTVCLGKISHYPDGRLYTYQHTGDGALEMPHSWDDVGLPYGRWRNGWDAFFGYADGSGRLRGESPPIESAEVDDDGYPDGLIARAAVQTLQQVRGRPFLLCVGFFKPHLPFCAPKKYFDLYDPATLPLSPNPAPPLDADPRSLHSGGEVFGNYRHGVENPETDPAHHRRLRHAYFACVSYVDAQIGKVLDELDRLDLSRNTIVILWGDHGWHLGDQSLWGKHTLYERSLRSPLIIRKPKLNSPGAAAAGIVETVDLYPTLAELCSLAPPDDLDGRSLARLIDDPSQPGKPAALGFWKDGQRTIRTAQHRLIVHPQESRDPAGFELYDHDADPLEMTNAAAHSPGIVASLMHRLEELGPSGTPEPTSP